MPVENQFEHSIENKLEEFKQLLSTKWPSVSIAPIALNVPYVYAQYQRYGLFIRSNKFVWWNPFTWFKETRVAVIEVFDGKTIKTKIHTDYIDVANFLSQITGWNVVLESNKTYGLMVKYNQKGFYSNN